MIDIETIKMLKETRREAQKSWLKKFAVVDHNRYKDLDLTKMTGQEIEIYAAAVEADHILPPEMRSYSDNAYWYAVEMQGKDDQGWEIYDFYNTDPARDMGEDEYNEALEKAQTFPNVLPATMVAVDSRK